MRCPKCGYVSFDDLDRCKRCGHDLSTKQRARGWGVPARTRPGGDEARPHKLADFLKKEPLTPRTSDETSLRGEQESVHRQLEILDQERQRLRRASLEFEQRHQQLEKKLREEIASERRAAQSEVARLRQTQANMLEELAALERNRKQAEETFRRLAADRERLEKQEADLAQRREAMRQEEERANRIEQEVRRLSEVSQQLKEEQERLRKEKEEAELARLAADQARQEAENMRREAEQARKEAEQQAAAHAEAVRRQAVEAKSTEFAAERERWRNSLRSDHKPSADDFVKMLGSRRREEPDESSPPSLRGLMVVKEEELTGDDEVVELEEYEDAPSLVGEPVEVVPPRYHVVAKGGLISRVVAAGVDLSLLLVVLGIFLVIGRLVTGGSASLSAMLTNLAMPFYLLFVLLALLYVTYLNGSSGQTLGKRLLGLKVLTTHGERLGYVNAFLRFVAMLFSVALLGLGVLAIGLDPNKQGWHDKIARTVVIRA